MSGCFFLKHGVRVVVYKVTAMLFLREVGKTFAAGPQAAPDGSKSTTQGNIIQMVPGSSDCMFWYIEIFLFTKNW